jgi:predicted phosphodiesterase
LKITKSYGKTIRLNRQTLTHHNGYAEVMFIGDAHNGSPQFDKDRFLKNIAYCLNNSLYVVLMGDLNETATRNSVGAGVYEQEEIAEDQHNQMVEWLYPLAERKLILGTLRGNHGERVYKETGFDVDRALARVLKIPFLGDACWNRFKVGSQFYDIYSLHGRSNARFDGTALLAVERISTSFFCDLLVHGHMHKAASSIVLMQRVKDGLVIEHKKYLLITGAYLKYDGGYASTVGLPISKLGSPKVRFYSERHDLTIHW